MRIKTLCAWLIGLLAVSAWADPSAEQFRVSAIVSGEGGSKVGLYDTVLQKASRWLVVGDTWQGHTLRAIFPDKQMVVVEKDTRLAVIYLRSAALLPEGASLKDGRVSLPNERPEAEGAQEAWPEGHRGAGIEQYLKENPNADPPYAADDRLPFEIKHGIDPNDPATWTPDYRGPAIERMLQGQEDDRDGKDGEPDIIDIRT